MWIVVHESSSPVDLDVTPPMGRQDADFLAESGLFRVIAATAAVVAGRHEPTWPGGRHEPRRRGARGKGGQLWDLKDMRVWTRGEG